MLKGKPKKINPKIRAEPKKNKIKIPKREKIEKMSNLRMSCEKDR
jgi:hypothetical protein